ncbi:hypothetical protein OGAPHI_000290 [Ogataea philodendri]|uniref:Nucleoporin POM34 n=1 Tax=Ogataea philodendri TaxID=1378263 RepID=A0A9P8PGT9_9ASCO|nr:uncharacterized protein OGAPHI_000290 [Ogataea philodendri]KAH3671587.1 hypothetical protein OGAPHI_000290 [Ogataea philodendri]
MSFLTPSASSINGTFHTPEEDTFLQTRRRIDFSAPNATNLSTPIALNRPSPSPSKSTRTLSPSRSNVAVNTPIKPLVYSPFKVPQTGRPLLASTPLAGPNTPSKGPMSPLLRKKFQEQAPESSEQTQDNSFASLNSQIYQRSIFKPRRKTPLQEISNKVVEEKPVKLDPQDDSELQSPYVELALQRMVNKDTEVRKVIISTLIILLYRFLVAVVVLVNVKIRLKDGTSLFPSVVAQYAGYLNKLIYGVLVLNIVVSSIRLLRPQDKCLDLPLTSRQRKLLGLPLVNGTDVQEDLVPKEGSLKAVQGSPAKEMADTSLLALDISRSFANMNISQTKIPNTVIHETPQERIRNQLLSRDKGPASPQARFQKPSSKFVYDTASRSAYDVNTSDVSFY